jgi:hypothetical protein
MEGIGGIDSGVRPGEGSANDDRHGGVCMACGRIRFVSSSWVDAWHQSIIETFPATFCRQLDLELSCLLAVSQPSANLIT